MHLEKGKDDEDDDEDDDELEKKSQPCSLTVRTDKTNNRMKYL